MPYIANTPESKIGRSDSLNPDTTCRGITSSGRPCRRPLNASPSASPAASPLKVPLKIPKTKKSKQLQNNDLSDPDSYCWQHKDQARLSTQSSPGLRIGGTPILERQESLEGVMSQLGISDNKKKRKSRNDSEKITQGGQSNLGRPPRRNTVKHSIFCCCFSLPIYEEAEERPVRPTPRPLQSAPAVLNTPKPPSNQYLSPSSGGQSGRTSSANSKQSRFGRYVRLISPSVPDATVTALTLEMQKEPSAHDEAGYIYIFWLTPQSKSSSPPVDAARDLLAPPSRPEGQQRRTSDVLQSFAEETVSTPKKTGGASKKTVLLKIGRASNVQRRLNEWTRQCGYDLSLIRYYPHIPSSQPSTPRKMPHSHKVERLIHLELSGLGLRVSDKGPCKACGKTHKEWFEVEATRKGIEMIDDIVKRWSDWDEGK
jgi:hypothetical protein